MTKAKKVRDKGIINKELLRRIDNITDESEFSPYNAQRKTSLKESELFNDHDYTKKEDDIILKSQDEIKKEQRENIIVGIVVAIAIAALIGGLIYIMSKGGLNL